VKIAFDVKLMRPGCVIIQAAFGGDRLLAQRFDPSTWLLAPSENLRLYEITPEQLDVLVERVNDKSRRDYSLGRSC
jgi:hypothetical protein